MKQAIALLGLATLPVHSETNPYLIPFEHTHFTAQGTPLTHSFGIEPALTGRDLFLDYSYAEGDGFSEQEAELELEWAFTRRLGIIVEVPYIWEDEDGSKSVSGFGDLAIVPRALLVDSECFLLTAQIETVLPTGSSSFGGETAIAPGISMWNDLGNWFTLNSQLGVEHVFDEDSTDFFFGLGLVKSFGQKEEPHDHEDEHHHHQTTAGLIHLHLEITGSTPTTGPDKGDFTTDGLIGISYGLTAAADIRAGYRFPIGHDEFDHGLTTGMIWHF